MGKNSASLARSRSAQALSEVAERKLLVLVGRQRLSKIHRRHQGVDGGCCESGEVSGFACSHNS